MGLVCVRFVIFQVSAVERLNSAIYRTTIIQQKSAIKICYVFFFLITIYPIIHRMDCSIYALNKYYQVLLHVKIWFINGVDNLN